MNRINDKISELEKYLEELKQIIPNSYEDYENNLEKKAACERYFEKIVEAIISISYLICKEERFEIDEKIKSLDILYDNGIINEILLGKLKDAKGMRNIIAHKYGEIDDLIVFESLTKELINDSFNFLKIVGEFLG